MCQTASHSVQPDECDRRQAERQTTPRHGNICRKLAIGKVAAVAAMLLPKIEPQLSDHAGEDYCRSGVRCIGLRDRIATAMSSSFDLPSKVHPSDSGVPCVPAVVK